MCGPTPVALEPGDIVFSFHRRSLISEMFAWFMQSRWSHCFLIVESTPLRTYEVEMANCRVVVSVFEDKYLNGNFDIEVWRPKNLSETTKLQIAAVGITNESKTFGFLKAICLGMKRLLWRIGICLPACLNDGITCAEVVLYPYSLVQGTPFTGMCDTSRMDTEDLHQMVMKGPFEKVFVQR